MKRSIFIVIGILALIALIALFLSSAKKPPATQFVDNHDVTIIGKTELPPATNKVDESSPPKTDSPHNQVTRPRKSKEEEMFEVLSTKNDMPIVFYGRVEDQFSNAVAGATVNFGVRIYNGLESGVKSGQTVSDVNGRFTISGYKGESLGIGVQKEGYAWVSMNGSGIYSQLYPEEQRAHPDPNNPTIIRMWKKQGAEPLVSINKEFKLPYTNAPIYFDLVAGKVVPAGGDVAIVVTREPGIISQRKEDHRDWSIKLLPVAGGILEPPYNTSHVTFEAPADSYQESYFLQMKQDGPGWFDNIQKAFFLKSRDGQIYSKFAFNFMINDDPNEPMWFKFSGIANTNSSRNWEASIQQ